MTRARLVGAGVPEALRSLFLAGREAVWRAEAAYRQRRFVGRYIAVTGSCGKTTTTALTGALLGKFGPTTTGLHNNTGDYVIRTVKKLRRPVHFVVQETSGHPPGAIDKTTATFSVDVAVVTAVGFDHGSSFRGPDSDVRDAIAREKGKLVHSVVPGGLACLNFDDPRVRAMASNTVERVVGFGTSADAEVRAMNVGARWPDRLHFDLVVAGRTIPVRTRFVGTIMLTNVLGALSVVHGLGLDIRRATETLQSIEPVHDCMGVHAGSDGKTYILDSKKAPYWSTALLVDDLRRLQIEGLTFVLGDISDVRGSSSKQYRKLIRSLAAEVETLVLVGRSAEYGAKVRDEGLGNIVVAPTALDVVRYLETQPAGVVLLKANETSQLWRVLDQVTASPNGQLGG